MTLDVTSAPGIPERKWIRRERFAYKRAVIFGVT
jgi:hypothetical protein